MKRNMSKLYSDYHIESDLVDVNLHIEVIELEKIRIACE